jgi:hypothetical protein
MRLGLSGAPAIHNSYYQPRVPYPILGKKYPHSRMLSESGPAKKKKNHPKKKQMNYSVLLVTTKEYRMVLTTNAAAKNNGSLSRYHSACSIVISSGKGY